MKGMVQVYTGNGKGKTTAALGLALRASGAGLKVFIGQFVKGQEYSELKAIEKIPGLELEQFGRSCFIRKEPEEEDYQAARRGLEVAAKKLSSGNYDIVILDEAMIALKYQLFSFADLWQAISQRAEGVEVIITGREAPKELIDKADLVTEMKEIKHYFQQGVKARVGIEK